MIEQKLVAIVMIAGFLILGIITVLYIESLHKEIAELRKEKLQCRDCIFSEGEIVHFMGEDNRWCRKYDNYFPITNGCYRGERVKENERHTD